MAGALGSIATSTWDGTDSELVYHHKDHLGGTHVETDETGSVLEYIVYKPFGGVLVDNKSGAYENNLKYTGKELDSDTGYYYYGARYYNGTYGRFLSQDPVYLAVGISMSTLDVLADPQSLNSYSYSRNNPINLNDPDGRQWEWVWKIFAVTETLFNVGTAFVPGISDARDAVEVVTGRDAITNQPLTQAQRDLTTSMLMAPIISGGLARKADDLMGGALSGMGRASRTSTIANTIANGHAFEKHVIQRGEFSSIVTREQFSAHIDNVMSNPTATRSLENGRTGYWHEPSGTVVIYNPKAADNGTAFVPADGVSFFNNDLK